MISIRSPRPCVDSAIAADVGEDRLRRFFTREEDSYRVKRELRDVVLFANHSVLKDPPFSRLDLISCRNLLIYLERDLQQQVLSTLHYGLTPSGFLFLGTSEGADHPDNLFRVVDREARLFQSAGRTSDRLPALPHLFGVSALEHASSAAQTAPVGARAAQAAHTEALETVAPPSILVDANNRVLHLSENAGRYLQPSAGPLTTDVTELAHQQFRFELRNALRRAFEHGETILSPALYVRFDGAPKRVYVQVRPIPVGDAERPRRALVLFIEGQDGESHAAGDSAEGERGSGETVQRLRQELEVAQANLRSTREESEATNEELRAANEELQSINEEYRSTAEELETSKEELQSINEELQTVNSELKVKLDTVSRANSDLQNLMSAMDFGVLFLDPALKIKRFTPKLADLFSITPADIGRPITDFAHQLDYDSFARDTQVVLRDLAPTERELRSRSGGWYLVRIRPYRTVDNKIDGVVATFVDITERRRMEEALRRSEQSLRQETRLVEASHAPIFVWDFDGGILQWNRGCEELYGYSKQEAIGRPVQELLHSHIPGGDREEMRQALLKDGAWHGELAQTTKGGQEISVDAKIELVSMGDRRFALESARDITLSKAWEARQRLLLDELTHRVKNVLAIVQSIISQTWRSAGTHEDFVERVQGRIVALAEAHKLLFASEWAGVDLQELVARELAPYGSGRPERVRLSGPTVTLPANVATSMALVLHELATNASKYGAFSSDAGYVELSWTLDEKGKANRLKLVWREHDGPPVTPPKDLGFGAGLIRDALPGSKVRHQFDPSGVVCTVEVDLEGEGNGAGDGKG